MTALIPRSADAAGQPPRDALHFRTGPWHDRRPDHRAESTTGKLICGNPPLLVLIDSRTLLHLKVVMISKLRRGESFSFTWDRDRVSGGGRTSVWISPAVPLVFEILDPASVPMNRAWIELLGLSADSPSGLRVLREPT